MTIPAYFSQIKAILETYAAADFVVETDLNFETRPGDQGYLKGRVTFSNATTLHFSEYLDQTGTQVDKLMYTYHYQAADRHLIFRYDNARHRPPLPTVEHKHLTDHIIEAPSPTLEDVLLEIVSLQGWL